MAHMKWWFDYLIGKHVNWDNLWWSIRWDWVPNIIKDLLDKTEGRNSPL